MADKVGKAIPVEAQWVPGDPGFRISRQQAHEGGEVSPTHRPP
jgi:hypothetical protein